MQLIPLKSELFRSGTDLKSALLAALKLKNETLHVGDIVVIASKVVAYSQGRLSKVGGSAEMEALIRSEADQVYNEGPLMMTMKNGILIPNAGVDSSNAPLGEVIFWPKAPFEAADVLRLDLQEEFNLKYFGVIISDSCLRPFRRGTGGIALGWSGFEGVVDERGKEDLYGQKMEYTQVGIADGLTSAANVLMGEVAERTPFVIIRGFNATFTDKKFSQENYIMPQEVDLFSSIMKLQ